jgi:transketolase
MSIAYEHRCSTFNKPEHTILDNNIYVIMGDGCNMEGVVSEAASLAGHLALGNLIVLYDDNHISIAGGTDLAFTEDVSARFRTYGWHTLDVPNGDTDLDAISAAIDEAKKVKDRPSFIKVTTVIGYKAPKQGTCGIHGSPLSGDDLKVLKKAYDLDPEKTFNIPEDVLAHYRTRVDEGKKKQEEWDNKFAAYAAAFPAEAKEFTRRMNRELPANFADVLPSYKPGDKAMATREVGGIVLNALAGVMPEIFGGSADLAPSTKTDIKSSHDFQLSKRDGRIIRFGVREHAMCAIGNGMHAYGGVVPFVATFLVFLSYCIASARLAALSRHQVLYIFTHDSIFVGEDGPTHQPIEVLVQARSIPNFNVMRPCDGNEVAGAYLAAIKNQTGPTLLALSRQGLPQLEGTSAESVLKGGYVLVSGGDKPTLVLVASGSEVNLCVDAAKKLGESVRVVSMPCMELFDAQSVEYRESVFFPGAPILSVEASSPTGWEKYAHAHICVTTFGASAKAADLAKHFGFTVENVVEKGGEVLKAFDGAAAPVLTRRLVFSNTVSLH